ncbi:MAG: hypothetical protein JOZ99_01635 [Actinobacteria bacterium]|nr:hypothetical protein [Actinomycetota bacterium]
MTATTFLSRRLAAVAAAVALASAAASCSFASTSTKGTLTGGIVDVRSSTPKQYSGFQPGVVTLRGASGIVEQVTLAVPGKTYKFTGLKPGLYLMQAQRPNLPADACKAAAQIAAGQTAHVNIICTLLS